MRSGTFGIVCGALVAAPSMGRAAGQAPAIEAWFLEAPPEATALVNPDPTFASERLVGVRGELLDEHASDGVAPLALQLALEPGAPETAVLDRREVLASGATVWSGSLRGAPQSSVHVVRRGDVFAATVRDGARLYKVNWAGAGWHRVARVDETRFPPCATGPEHAVAARDGAAPSGGFAANSNPTIDVMVVYTPLARQNAGGVASIEALIDLAVVETNQAYANSQVNQRLRLVHQEELAGYAENGDFNTELTRLTNTNDGWFDGIHALRDQYGADEVAMIVDSTQYCGIGWLMTVNSTSFQDRAFSVTSKQCATGYYSFAHELGHTMASHHDHANAGSALFSYSYGYRTASGNWRTIMAYAPGTRIQYFSNPNVSYQGEALGIPEGQQNAAENWKSLNNTAATVAQFRCAVPAVYGTGKVNSLGQRPSLSFSGSTSASANAFHVLVSNAVPNKVGLVFFGTQTNNAPLSGGTLWVGGTITRLAPLAANGSGAADFAFPVAGIPPGDVVYAQHWGRDPQHPDGTGASLSDALRIDVCP